MTWRVSRGPQDLGPEPPAAMGGVLACLSGIDGGSAPPTVERLARLTGTEPSSTSSTSCTSTDPRADPPASRRSLVWADLKREARALLGASLTRHLGCAAGKRSPAADAGGRRP